MHSIGMQEQQQQQQLAVLVVIFAITLSVLRAEADSCCKWEGKLQGDAAPLGDIGVNGGKWGMRLMRT